MTKKLTINQVNNTRLDKQAKKGKIPHHKFVIKIYRPITPNMAKWLVDSWCKFYTKGIAFGISEYSISYEE